MNQSTYMPGEKAQQHFIRLSAWRLGDLTIIWVLGYITLATQ